MRVIALFALFIASAPAMAFEPTGSAVADTFLAAVERAGFGAARIEGVERDGEATVLTNLAAGGADSGKAIAIARTAIDKPIVNAANDLLAAAIRYEDVEIRDKDGNPTSSIDMLVLADVRLAGADEADGDVANLLGGFDTIRIEGLSARSEAGEEITLRALEADLATSEAEGVAAGSISLEGLLIDVTLLDEPTASEIKALGYETLDVAFRATGEWEAATGRAVLSGARLGVAGMGAVELDAGANGLTAATYETLKAGGVDFARLLEVLGTVSFTGMTVTLEDGGLTGLLLDRLASGSDRAKVVAQLVEALAVPLASLGDPAFAQEAIAAVKTFLDDPGRLTIAATPATDVTALQVIGAAMLNPKLLPSLLSLKVSGQ